MVAKAPVRSLGKMLVGVEWRVSCWHLCLRSSFGSLASWVEAEFEIGNRFRVPVSTVARRPKCRLSRRFGNRLRLRRGVEAR